MWWQRPIEVFRSLREVNRSRKGIEEKMGQHEPNGGGMHLVVSVQKSFAKHEAHLIDSIALGVGPCPSPELLIEKFLYDHLAYCFKNAMSLPVYAYHPVSREAEADYVVYRKAGEGYRHVGSVRLKLLHDAVWQS